MEEYYCPRCRDWQEAAYCQSHFEYVHGEKGYTFDMVKDRYAQLGGLEIRDTKAAAESTGTKRKGNWLFNEDDGPDFFVTNNFRHRLK
jgi:hypothetical protein